MHNSRFLEAIYYSVVLSKNENKLKSFFENMENDNKNIIIHGEEKKRKFVFAFLYFSLKSLKKLRKDYELMISKVLTEMNDENFIEYFERNKYYYFNSYRTHLDRRNITNFLYKLFSVKKPSRKEIMLQYNVEPRTSVHTLGLDYSDSIEEIITENVCFNINAQSSDDIVKKIKRSEIKKILDLFLKKDDFVIVGSMNILGSSVVTEKIAEIGVEIFDLGYFFVFLENVILKKRKNKDTYIVFDTNNFIRMKFSNNYNEKSPFPEIIYIKICNYYPFAYFTNSSKKFYVPFSEIKKYVNVFSKMNTCEVILEGEPTLHPDFYKIIEFFKSRNIVPSFVTRSCQFIFRYTSQEKEKLYKNIGNIIVDIKEPNDLLIFEMIDEDFRKNFLQDLPKKVIARHLLGSVSINETIDIIRQFYHYEYPLIILDSRNFYSEEKIPRKFDAEELDMVFSFIYDSIFTENKKFYSALFPLYSKEIVDKNIFEENRNNKYKTNSNSYFTNEISKNYVKMRSKRKIIIPNSERGFRISLSLNDKFILNFSSLLYKLEIPSYLEEEGWGKFSMYVDTLENFMAICPSSEKKIELKKEEINARKMLKYWNQMKSEKDNSHIFEKYMEVIHAN